MQCCCCCCWPGLYLETAHPGEMCEMTTAGEREREREREREKIEGLTRGRDGRRREREGGREEGQG